MEAYFNSLSNSVYFAGLVEQLFSEYFVHSYKVLLQGQLHINILNGITCFIPKVSQPDTFIFFYIA